MRNSSVDFLFNCFPSLMGSIPPSVVSNLFPPSTDTLCPTPTLAVGTLTMSWPCLLPLCLLGIVIGIHGGRSCRSLSSYMSNAFYLFSVMNVFAFLTHSVFKTFSHTWWFTYRLDMAATSASSFNLILGALHLTRFATPPPWMPTFSLYVYMPICVFVLQLSRGSIPWVPEVMYIGVTIIAACAMAYLIVLPAVMSRPAPNSPESARHRATFHALLVVVIGASMFAGGVLLDKYLCSAEQFVGGRGWGNMLVPAFGGCDLAFWGLARYLDLVNDRSGQIMRITRKLK
jgi:hypothetical protein